MVTKTAKAPACKTSREQSSRRPGDEDDRQPAGHQNVNRSESETEENLSDNEVPGQFHGFSLPA